MTDLRWTLYRDGKIVHHFRTETDMWHWLHRQHSYSVSHAFRYEGYSATVDGKPYVYSANQGGRHHHEPAH